jgi:hypothetical protein
MDKKKQKRLQKQVIRKTAREDAAFNPVLHTMLRDGDAHTGKDVRAPRTEPTPPDQGLPAAVLLRKRLKRPSPRQPRR